MRTATILALTVLGAASANASSTIMYYVDIFGGCTNQDACPGGSPTGSDTATTTPILLSSVNQETGGTTNTVYVPEFDTGLGTLNSVSIDLDAEFVGGLEVINVTGASHGFIDGFASIPLSISGTSLPTLNTSPGVSGLSGTVPAFTAYQSPSDTYTDSDSSGLITTGLAAYEVPGTFSYNVCQISANCNASSGATQVGGSGALFNGTYGYVGGVLEVTYNYTPTLTPEPASLLLVGGLLLGGAVTWRRRTGPKG